MFSNSKKSEFDPRGGQHYSNNSDIQKFLNYPVEGWGGGYEKPVGVEGGSLKLCLGWEGNALRIFDFLTLIA